MKKIISSILTFIMLFSALSVNVFAASNNLEECFVGECNISNLTFISNTSRKQYIQNAINYYITNTSSISNALNNNKVAIFMFEGGSDNVDKENFHQQKLLYSFR